MVHFIDWDDHDVYVNPKMVTALRHEGEQTAIFLPWGVITVKSDVFTVAKELAEA